MLLPAGSGSQGPSGGPAGARRRPQGHLVKQGHAHHGWRTHPPDNPGRLRAARALSRYGARDRPHAGGRPHGLRRRLLRGGARAFAGPDAHARSWRSRACSRSCFGLLVVNWGGFADHHHPAGGRQARPRVLTSTFSIAGMALTVPWLYRACSCDGRWHHEPGRPHRRPGRSGRGHASLSSRCRSHRSCPPDDLSTVLLARR